MMRDVVFRRCARAPALHATRHVDLEKRVPWFSISMLACSSLKIVMVLRLAALFILRFILQLVFEIKSPEFFSEWS